MRIGQVPRSVVVDAASRVDPLTVFFAPSTTAIDYFLRSAVNPIGRCSGGVSPIRDRIVS